MADQTHRWEYGGRFYGVVKFSDVSTRDGYGWELHDEAPAPDRGVVLEAFWDDTENTFTFRAFTERPLPFALVQRFVTEAARGVPPASPN